MNKYFIPLLLFVAIQNTSLAQTLAANDTQQLETYNWMLNMQWSIYDTDHWIVQTSIEDLVKEDYSFFELFDRWNTGELIKVLSVDVSITRRDRKLDKLITKQFHLIDNNLSPALSEIEKCGDAGDRITFDNIIITLDGKSYRVKGFYSFEFK
ncbi:MAG TPA: hypothetical protein ENK52_06390 [Saprospiraceae bacterium]|nr:hypothetical protein [Saprospiraceae bacterium]